VSQLSPLEARNVLVVPH